MNDDKDDQPLPQRDPMQTLADWDRASIPSKGAENERPWASPSRPPWAGHTEPTPKKGIPAWALVVIVLGSLFIVCSGLVAAGLAGGEPTPSLSVSAGQERTGHIPAAPAVDNPPVAPATTYAVGKVFSSGYFQYTIHGVKTGVARVGGEYVEHRAQGVFTRVDLTVKNTSDEPHYFDTDVRVKVEDATGRLFSADGMANAVGNEGRDGWATEVNPGNSIRAFAFFDLPKDAVATRAVVSAGLFTFKADVVVPLVSA